MLRQGLPSAVGEALLKSADYEIYVRDRSPQAHFAGKAYVLPRQGQKGAPLVTVNTAKVAIDVYRIGDRNLLAAVGRDEPALAMRLIVQRKTPEAAEAARLALRRAAAKKGKALDPRSLIAADFMIPATSLSRSGYSAKAVLAAYRLRWQIELAFKRLKSLLHIDRLPTHTERGSRSWLYAHLILALLCDDLSQDFLESSP